MGRPDIEKMERDRDVEGLIKAYLVAHYPQSAHKLKVKHARGG